LDLIALPLLLGIVTLSLYWQTSTHDFVNYDDSHYVTGVPEVLRGLSWRGVQWAFSFPMVNCPHPLAYISLMLDSTLYGNSASGYLLTNVVLHAASTIVLFFLLAGATNRRWLSFGVAAIFAWHPTHAESVAWISERKDVLSVFFSLLTIAGYFNWVSHKRKYTYFLLVVLPFLCALFSKPSVVTLPCVLMLTDVWPLRRIGMAGPTANWFSNCREVVAAAFRYLPEKLALFGMGAVISALTWRLSEAYEVNAPWAQLPLGSRVIHAISAYAFYVSKFFVPLDLAALHIHPRQLPPVVEMCAWLCIFALITVLSVKRLRPNPALLIGWLWFIGTLLPVSGIFQNGIQLVANRYTYFPYIGLAIVVFFGLFDGVNARRGARAFCAAAIAGIWLCWIAWIAKTDAIPAWQNSTSLWSKALSVNPHNEIALSAYAAALIGEKRYTEAFVYQEAAVRIAPYSVSMRRTLSELAAVLASRQDHNVPNQDDNGQK
jgi:hypothetical protein